MVKQWKNEDIIYPEDAQRWEDGLEDAKQNNSQNATNLKSHTDNKSNPHNVTAAQTGAYTKAEADSKDAAVLTSAKSYTDLHSVKKDNPHGVTAGQTGAYTKAEADERDASTLSAAKSYSDTKKTEATTYTDQKVATAKSEIQSGSVTSANKLTTARKIAGIDFDGTKDISIPANNVGAYTKAEADSKVAAVKSEISSGNVATATKLQTARRINGTTFDGTSDITVKAVPQTDTIPENADLNDYKTVGFYGCSLNVTAATIKNVPAQVAFSLVVMNAANTSITTQIFSEYTTNAGTKMWIRRCYTTTWGSWYQVAVADGTLQSGLFAQTASKLSSERTISLSGGATGSASFDGSGNISIATTLAGNAPSATKLATARTIAGVSFDGTSNIAIAAGNVGAYTKEEVDSKLAEVADPSWIDVSQYLSSSFRLYSGSEGSKIKVQVANKGTLIISGIVSPTKVLNFPNNTQEYDLVSIPKSVLGVSGSWSICPIIEQASGAQVWLLGMEDNGTNLIFKMSRHRYGTTWTDCNAGDWLPFNGIVRLVL